MPPVSKRTLPDEFDHGQSVKPKRALSFAAKLNAKILGQLQKAFERDPEIDLTTVLPKGYSARLESRKVVKDDDTPSSEDNDPVGINDRPTINIPEGEATINKPLSDKVKALLETYGAKDLGKLNSALTGALHEVLMKSEVLWQSKTDQQRYVARCSPEIVVKSVCLPTDFTEYTSLQYLELHMPHLLVPRPHGIITMGKSAFIFMSLIPGVPLSKIWPEMKPEQKKGLSQALDKFFLDLRQLHRPDTMPLGGTAGEGCKDNRRYIRRCLEPFYTSAELWNFQYSNAPVGSEIYLEFLRRLTLPFQSQDHVFTHGDLRPDNIIVETHAPDSCYRISGIIDWEMSGFYPKDFECIKVTNNLATNEVDDWYLYLPPCISPEMFPARWLSDLAWDKQIV